MKKIFMIMVVGALMLALLPATAAVADGFEVSVSPLIDENLVGEEHTVTVTLGSSLGEDDEGVVDFEVFAGPNEGEAAEVELGEGDSEASFTYTSNGDPGLDVIHVYVEINETHYPLEIEFNGVSYPDDYVYKLWLTDKVSGGGKIVQQDGPKRKDWNKITWSGWAGFADEGVAVGQFEATFHNVSEDDLDKCKFVSTDAWIGVTELAFLGYKYEPLVGPANPPPSFANVACFFVTGDLLDKHSNPIAGDWYLVVITTDGGEGGNPGPLDSIGFELWDGNPWDGGTREYASYDADFDEPVPDAKVHLLDSGNVQIVVPYELDG